MSKETDDIEFDELLAEKRHKEHLGILKAVKLLLEKPPDTSIALSIEKLVAKLEGMKPPEALPTPDVIVNVGQEKVITSVEKLERELLIELRKFNSRPIATQFDIVYEYGNLRTVKIVWQDQMKPKYQA